MRRGLCGLPAPHALQRLGGQGGVRPVRPISDSNVFARAGPSTCLRCWRCNVVRGNRAPEVKVTFHGRVMVYRVCASATPHLPSRMNTSCDRSARVRLDGVRRVRGDGPQPRPFR